MNLPKQVKMVEVGPRDGLQNEAQFIPTAIKVELINKLVKTGLKTVEVTSFVSPKWVPQMADSCEVLSALTTISGVSYPVLVPNLKGLQAAIQAGAKEIAIFGAASETFSQKNINCSIKESLKRFEEVCSVAAQHHIKIRGYISCVLGCPYEGEIKPQQVLNVAQCMQELGCYEISLGDTIGIGTPKKAARLIEIMSQKIPLGQLAAHFHDTYGQALANIYAVLECGIATIDSSIAGLGGCPYAQGASGNVASEDVLYLLNGLEIETGVDLQALVEVGVFISHVLGRETLSKVGKALYRKN